MTNYQATGSGSLYIVATPIGNLEDISARAIAILKSVDYILAEDTRHSQHLLQALGINTRLSSLHAFNEGNKSQYIIEQLLQGKHLALISDAGTPLISDPGYPLVHQARQHHIPVIPIPGACALIAALSASGVACDSFTFVGFLPAKQAARLAKLQDLHSIAHTLVVYESTHRLVESLEDIETVFGQEITIVVAKELTKTFERFISGTVREIKKCLLDDKALVKGEFVIIIPPREVVQDLKLERNLLSELVHLMPVKQAVTLVAKFSPLNKNALYDLALELK